MKQHSEGFKEAQISLGKEQDIIITYGNTTLTSENVNSFNYNFEGNILKSIMTCIELETTEDIPLNTKFNLQYGLKVGEDYEYLNFNNYIVYSSEKQEDKASYRIIAYDEMLDTMKDYVQVEIPYPCTIDDYISALATQLGYTYTSSVYPNYNQTLNGDYFVDAGMTYRDVLDDLAEVTASNIIIKNNELLLVSPVETNETFDDAFIKTTNAEFSNYGPINSIVLSRSISDNVYAKNQESIEENGLFEIKISDNQIMNNNDRNRFISAIYNKLQGMTFKLCDFESVGIAYLEPLDNISIQIGETIYNNVIVFNDDYKSDNGISERIHIEEPTQSQTDYKKADTTDQRINQTNLIVDKQQQTITGLITNVDDNIEKVAELTQTVDGFSADIQQANTNANEARQQTAQLSLDVAELRSEIGDVIDITVTEEGYGELNFEDINQSEPITITIHSMGADIKYLYPSETLYPGTTRYPLSRTIIFENIDTEEKIEYTIPADLLWYSSTIYDEFYMDFDSTTCQITKRVGIDEYGEKYPLVVEEVITYTYPYLPLTDGDYRVYTPSYPSAYLKVRLMHQNPYVTQFATRAEMNSAITQSATEIETRVAQTYYLKEEGHTLESRVTQTESSIESEVADRTNSEADINSRITQNANAITSEVTNRQNADNAMSSRITQNANSISAEVTNRQNADNTINGKIELKVDKSDNNQVVSMINASANRITLNSNRLVVNSDNFKVASDGTIKATNGEFSGTVKMTGQGSGGYQGAVNTELTPTMSSFNWIRIGDDSNHAYLTYMNGECSIQGGWKSIVVEDVVCNDELKSNRYNGFIPTGKIYDLYYLNIHQGSKKELKENFEKLNGEDALKIIENTDIYKYNLKEDNKEKRKKKHIGLVIGDDFNYAKELTDVEEEGVDIYAMTSVCLQAIKELKKEIEELKK